MSDAAFNSILTEVDNLSYEQCAALLAHLSKVFMDKKIYGKTYLLLTAFLLLWMKAIAITCWKLCRIAEG